MARPVGKAPLRLLPSASSMDHLGFLHTEFASPTKLRTFLSFSSSLQQKVHWSSGISTKLKLQRKRVYVLSVCQLGLQSELPSDFTAEGSAMTSSNLFSERGIFFSTGPSFFRAQSSLGRDLAVLAAALYKRSEGRLRVLDAMSGCGVRALRYLTQSEADFVVANDCNPGLHTTLVENLSRYAPFQGLHCPPGPFTRYTISEDPRKPCRTEDFSRDGYRNNMGIESHSSIVNSSNTENPNISREAEKQLIEAGNFEPPATESRSLTASANTWSTGPLHTQMNTQHEFETLKPSNGMKWQVCHEEAARLLLKCSLNMDFYDFIDVDSFGSDSFFIGPALSSLRFGGLLFVTCTDGFSSGGHRPYNSLAQYGSFMQPMPYANELGLRMLMGAVVKEASIRNMTVSPVFSVYAPHGPVFRVLLRATPGKLNRNIHYRFIYYCGKCGDSNTVDWENLGSMCCPCSEKVTNSLKVSGPLWTGPLHNAKDIGDMIALAKEWGWIPDVAQAESLSSSSEGRRKKKQEKLLELLNMMLEESQPELSFGYIHLDEIGKRGKVQTPRRERLIQALRNEGYIVSRSQICANAVKTNCSMTSCIALARRLADTRLRGNF